MGVQLYRLFVVHGGLLRNSQAEVAVPPVFVKVVLPSEPQTLLQNHYAFRIAAQLVQGGRLVVVQVQRQLELLRRVLDLPQNAFAGLYALFGLTALEIEVGEVLRCRQVFRRVLQRRF